MIASESLLFEVPAPLGFSVRVTNAYWRRIISTKHPSIKGRENAIKTVLTEPEEVRVSRKDANVYLFYKIDRPRRWLCAVVKRLNGKGFLITAYPTDAIKEGIRTWPK